ncbi:NYN domain protein [Burkholderia thailandensis MSMB121]|nr:NYN domain protein [Burkholderia thailandensis MSMB121]ATF32556.1 NYN domain-containing protein [Burkholderia thailandensis]
MALPQDSVNMALFCDFENIALGVRDTKFEKFDIRPVLEKLLLKGSIVVKKAYCDWDRYKTFKAAMHEASFELIEIPHVRQSGKNSADIRLVVDALDLCYTKAHVDTFVIISGDSDFSPLVSKLRENAKRVIGVGVKNSTSDLLVANCDEFIFYDDLAREQQRALAKRDARKAEAGTKRATDDDKHRKHDGDARKAEAISLAVETFDALAFERGESGKIWASVLKSAIKRRKPDFNESYYGFRAFGNLLEEAQARGLLGIGRDDKSGTFVFRPIQTVAVEAIGPAEATAAADDNHALAKPSSKKAHGKGRGAKKRVPEQMPLIVETAAGAEGHAHADIEADDAHDTHPAHGAHEPHETRAAHEPARTGEAAEAQAADTAKPARSRARKTPVKKAKGTQARAASASPVAADEADAAGEPTHASPPESATEAAPAKAPRKSAPRARRPRKTAATSES